MSKLFFKPPAASNPSPKSFIKLLAGTAMIFPLGKRNKTSWPENGTFQRPFEMRSIFCYCIFFPRGRVSFGQHQEWRLLGRSKAGDSRTSRHSAKSDWLSTRRILCACSKKSDPASHPTRGQARGRDSRCWLKEARPLLLLLITLKRLVTISNGIILTFWHCKVNDTLFIQELQLALNVNVSSEIFLLYYESFSIVSLHRQFPFETPISTADVFRLSSRSPLV